MIQTAIRFKNNMVMVFDKKGEQIPKYQGQYENVKESVTKNAPAEAVFAHGISHDGELQKVTRVEW